MVHQIELCVAPVLAPNWKDLFTAALQDDHTAIIYMLQLASQNKVYRAEPNTCQALVSECTTPHPKTEHRQTSQTLPHTHVLHHCVFLTTVTWLPVCVLMK